MTVIKFIFSSAYFYLPAALANMGAVFSRAVPVFNSFNLPIDLGKKIKGKRLIGDHKTFGGYIFGVLLGTLAGFVKFIFFDGLLRDYLLFDLGLEKTIFLYFIMSNGALLGDLIKSIFKRLFNIPPHSAWIPFDEIDHSVVSMLLASFIIPLDVKIFFTVVVVYFFIHLISNFVGYWLKLKKVPY